MIDSQEMPVIGQAGVRDRNFPIPITDVKTVAANDITGLIFMEKEKVETGQTTSFKGELSGRQHSPVAEPYLRSVVFPGRIKSVGVQ